LTDEGNLGYCGHYPEKNEGCNNEKNCTAPQKGITNHLPSTQ